MSETKREKYQRQLEERLEEIEQEEQKRKQQEERRRKLFGTFETIPAQTKRTNPIMQFFNYKHLPQHLQNIFRSR